MLDILRLSYCILERSCELSVGRESLTESAIWRIIVLLLFPFKLSYYNLDMIRIFAQIVTALLVIWTLCIAFPLFQVSQYTFHL